MYITPLGRTGFITDIAAESGSPASASGAAIPFSDFFKEAVDNVKTTDAIAKQDAIDLSTGKSDDVHTAIINAEKAELALQLLVQVRNKAIDAYSEIMRITL